MNKRQKEELINLIGDFLTNADHLYEEKKYFLKAYTNKQSTKVPISFESDKRWLDNLTIDYYHQEILEECNGFNMSDDYVVLGCELEMYRGINEIRYFYNQDLSDELNKKFARV